MKFLICGIGSIGQRHYKNLISLGHEVALFRSGTPNTPFVDKFLKEHKPQEFFHINNALLTFEPDAVFITNPNSEHIHIALAMAMSGYHLFIEKPVSHNLDGLNKLQELVARRNIKVAVGYNLRFHPLLKKMKDMMGLIGKPLAANVQVGENVEDWHPWEDYSKTFSVKKEGGAVLCFSHDIDYLYWFLGMPSKILAVGGKLTPLKSEAEDMVKSIWQFPNGTIASIHIDYWQRPKTRTFELIGAKGKFIWDEGGKLTLLLRDGTTQQSFIAEPTRNDTYIDEVKDFIDAIENDRQPAVNLKQGIDVLKIALDIKEQLR